MTPDHDHATLFKAPPAQPGAEPEDGKRRSTDDTTEEMRRLRHPFAVPPAPPARNTETS